MTRHSPFAGFPSGQNTNDQQQQYGGNPGPGQGYGQQGYNNQQQQQQPYNQYGPGAPSTGSAQSYYGSNDQPYQQYAGDNSAANPAAYGQPGHPNAPYSPQPSYQQHQQPYGGQYQDQSYQGYNRPPPPPPHYGQEGPVDNFRTHFEQPNGPIDPNHNPSYPPQQPHELGNNPENPTPNEEDRGIMGAIAGGAAGGYAGHKMHHGILGGIGGAIGGSMLEHEIKKKKKEKKQRRNSNSSSSSSSSSSDDEKHHHGRNNAPVFAGNFSGSSHSMRIEGHSTLVAECKDIGGHHRQSRIDLNDCLTNSWGNLEWSRGGNFAASARHLRLEDGGKILEAELNDGNGGWKWQKVRLDEHISNDDGRLVMV